MHWLQFVLSMALPTAVLAQSGLAVPAILSAQAPRTAGSSARSVVLLPADSASSPTIDTLVPLTIAALGHVASQPSVQALSRRDVQRAFDIDLPWLATLSIPDRLEAGKQLHAAILDLRVEHGNLGRIAVWPTLRWQGHGDGVAWEAVAAPSLEGLAEQLARRIAADSTLRRIFVPQTGCPTAALFEFQVDSQATYIEAPSARVHPIWGGYDGSLVEFVVGTLGRPEASTLKLLKVNAETTLAVIRDAFVLWRFVPARAGRCHVRQLVQVVVNR